MPFDAGDLLNVLDSDYERTGYREKGAAMIATWRITLTFLGFLIAGVVISCIIDGGKGVVPISIGASIAGLIAGIVWHVRSKCRRKTPPPRTSLRFGSSADK